MRYLYMGAQTLLAYGLMHAAEGERDLALERLEEAAGVLKVLATAPFIEKPETIMAKLRS
jgi:hypothetical protein